MAREKAVTRTVKGTTAFCKVFDLAKMQMVDNIVAGIPSSVSEVDVPKYCEKVLNSTGKVKFLMVEKMEHIEEVYGMKFNDFMKYAVKLTSDRKFPDGTSADEA